MAPKSSVHISQDGLSKKFEFCGLEVVTYLKGLEEYFDYDDLFNIAPQFEEKDKSTKEVESSKKNEEEIVEENEKVVNSC